MKWTAGVLTWSETYSIDAEGERHDGDGKNTRGMRHIQGKNGVPEKPGILALDACADTTGYLTTYYLWVDTNGKLRIHTAVPTNQDGDGTVVGAQTA